MPKRRERIAPVKGIGRRESRETKLCVVVTAVQNAQLQHFGGCGEVVKLNTLIKLYNLEAELKMKQAQIVAYMRLAHKIETDG